MQRGRVGALKFEDRTGILPKTAYRGQGVCHLLRSAPGDPRNGRLWHCVTSDAGPHGGAQLYER
jgi:hypothetical protein